MNAFETYMSEKDKIRNSINSHIMSMLNSLPIGSFESIMDIGSGTGVTLLSLLEVHEFRAYCIDIDKDSLDVLRKNASDMGKENNLEIIQMDMRDIDFPPEYFDLILSEGSVQFIGFEKALKEWGRMVKKGGYLIIHTDIFDKEERLRLVKDNDFNLLSMSDISKEEWLNTYMVPLLELIRKTSSIYQDDVKLNRQLQKDSAEVNMAMENLNSLSSMIYLLEKI